MDGFVIDRLRATLGDRLTTPDDPDYHDARQTFNATIQRRPAAIVRARSDDDVVTAVVAAGDLGLPIAVRGGGHSVAGHAMADGALVVDMRDLRAVRVDPATRIVRAQAGALWEDVDGAAWAHHLAVVGGTFGDTGVAGLALGGGIGWLSGLAGFTCDNLLRAELVTAAGERVVAGPDGDPDLLWALRGGGGNFGVVTSFEFRAIDPGPIVAGYIAVPAPRRATGPPAAGRGRGHRARRPRAHGNGRGGRRGRPASSSGSGCAGRATRRRRPTSSGRSRPRSRR